MYFTSFRNVLFCGKILSDQCYGFRGEFLQSGTFKEVIKFSAGGNPSVNLYPGSRQNKVYCYIESCETSVQIFKFSEQPQPHNS